MAEKELNKGGRLAANPRRANIAEGLAIQMFRPFAAVAPTPREEDHGIDLIATLIRKEGKCMVAEDSFAVQVKTHSAANFFFAGDGIKWLTQLRLPYFPVVVNLNEATVSLYTLNRFHMPLHASMVKVFNFCIPNAECECDGIDDFPLEEPLMRWSISDAAHPDFPAWAYAILKPAIQIETNNFQYGRMWRFVTLWGGPYTFDPANPVPANVPKAGNVLEIPPGNGAVITEALRNVIGPFVNWASNGDFEDDRSGDVLQLRNTLRRLGFDPDPQNRWDSVAESMAFFANKKLEEKSKPAK